MSSHYHPNRSTFDLRLVALGLALLCAVATLGRAATITVTSTADTGAGTLRNALASSTNGDTIRACHALC